MKSFSDSDIKNVDMKVAKRQKYKVHSSLALVSGKRKSKQIVHRHHRIVHSSHRCRKVCLIMAHALSWARLDAACESLPRLDESAALLAWVDPFALRRLAMHP